MAFIGKYFFILRSMNNSSSIFIIFYVQVVHFGASFGYFFCATLDTSNCMCLSFGSIKKILVVSLPSAGTQYSIQSFSAFTGLWPPLFPVNFQRNSKITVSWFVFNLSSYRFMIINVAIRTLLQFYSKVLRLPPDSQYCLTRNITQSQPWVKVR